jgi:hypothetical protein
VCLNEKSVSEGVEHTPNFGADWITSGFTPNICNGLPPLGLDITRSLYEKDGNGTGQI